MLIQPTRAGFLLVEMVCAITIGILGSSLAMRAYATLIERQDVARKMLAATTVARSLLDEMAISGTITRKTERTVDGTRFVCTCRDERVDASLPRVYRLQVDVSWRALSGELQAITCVSAYTKRGV